MGGLRVEGVEGGGGVLGENLGGNLSSTLCELGV
jgi:hypothetical protein